MSLLLVGNGFVSIVSLFLLGSREPILAIPSDIIHRLDYKCIGIYGNIVFLTWPPLLPFREQAAKCLSVNTRFVDGHGRQRTFCATLHCQLNRAFFQITHTFCRVLKIELFDVPYQDRAEYVLRSVERSTYITKFWRASVAADTIKPGFCCTVRQTIDERGREGTAQ